MLRFAKFELDRGAYQLRRAGRPVHLEPIPLDLLFLLAERRGQLVTRDEIVERIWKGVFLDSDTSINVAVRKIRQALGDDAEAPRFVVTVPAKGYRFIADVREESLAASNQLAGRDISYRTGQVPSQPPAEKPGAQHEQPRTATLAPAGRLAWGRFIGRAEEMAALRAAIDAAIGGQASLAMVVGEPGIGKTRLAEEAGIYAQQRGAHVLVGHCYEGEAASPYSPFVEAIREYVSTRPDDALKTEMGDGASDLAKLVPETCERFHGLAPAPATDPREERMRLFDSVASFLINASKENPVMLHLDDLHWADKPSLLLLQHLARRFKQSRLLVVVTYRDIELGRSHPLSAVLAELRHERLYQRMLLQGLPESEVKDLIEAISQQKLEGPGEAFVRAVLRETEGNPFFIEEVLRHLVESGGLYRRNGGWVTDPKAVADMKVPEDVRNVIGRRLARLSESTNRALEAAAVLGREFEFEVLGQMNALGKDTIVPAVEEALGHRLLVETQDGGRPRYAFTHALVRQTLYEGLRLRRQHLHLEAAHAIETVHEHNLEPHVTALANHYRMAGAAADSEKTIDYSIRAGSAAYVVFAYEEAEAYWRAALELMDEQGGGDRKRRAELLWRLGAYDFISSAEKKVEYLEAAAPLFEEVGDNEAACDVHLRLTSGLYAWDMQRVMSHLKKAEAFLATQPESFRHAIFYFGVAGACDSKRRISDALAAGKRAMEICERLPPTVSHTMALRASTWGYVGPEKLWPIAAAYSSNFLVLSGSVTEGLRLADEAWRREEPTRSATDGSAVAVCVADNYLSLRSPREAQKWYKRELAKPGIAHGAVRTDHMAYSVRQLLIGALIQAGELAEARSYLAEVDAADKPAALLFFEGEWELAGKQWAADFERTRRTGNLKGELFVALSLGGLYRFTGQRAQCVQLWQRALDICIDSGDIAYELLSRCSLAIIIAEAGDARKALPHLDRCRQIVAAGENWFGLAGSVERAEAVVAAAQAKYAVAEPHFEKAIATFQHCYMLWEEALTFRNWGCALLAAGEPDRAIEKFDAAIEIYRSHGAGTGFIEYVMVDKMRAQESISTHAEVPPPLTYSTRAVAAGSAQERPHLVAQSRSNGSRIPEKLVRASQVRGFEDG